MILSVRDLAAGYNDQPVVDDINFSVERGRALGIVGESGSGKSTIAKALTHFCRIFSGEVSYDGALISGVKPKRIKALRSDIQMIIQDSKTSFPTRMTVQQYIEEAMISLCDLDKVQRKARILELLDSVGLDKALLRRYPFELSGGQRQRVAITRALAIEPKLLICDEITSALDVTVQRQIGNLLKRLRSEKDMTFIFISHDIAFLSELCEHLIIMYKGRIVERLAADDLHNAKHPHTRALINSTFQVTVQSNSVAIVSSRPKRQ